MKFCLFEIHVAMIYIYMNMHIMGYRHPTIIFGNPLRLTINDCLVAKRVEIVPAKRAFDSTCCTSERVN